MVAGALMVLMVASASPTPSPTPTPVVYATPTPKKSIYGDAVPLQFRDGAGPTPTPAHRRGLGDLAVGVKLRALATPVPSEAEIDARAAWHTELMSVIDGVSEPAGVVDEAMEIGVATHWKATPDARGLGEAAMAFDKMAAAIRAIEVPMTVTTRVRRAAGILEDWASVARLAERALRAGDPSFGASAERKLLEASAELEAFKRDFVAEQREGGVVITDANLPRRQRMSGATGVGSSANTGAVTFDAVVFKRIRVNSVYCEYSWRFFITNHTSSDARVSVKLQWVGLDSMPLDEDYQWSLFAPAGEPTPYSGIEMIGREVCFGVDRLDLSVERFEPIED